VLRAPDSTEAVVLAPAIKENPMPRLYPLLALALAYSAASLATAQDRIYLVEYKFNDPKLYTMQTDGSDLTELVGYIPTGEWLPVGLQVDTAAGKLYWTHGSFNQGRISRINLDGTDRESVLTGLTNPRGLALDLTAGKMYWSDTQDNRLYRADLDGGSMETVIDRGNQLGRPYLDLAGGKLYYGDFTAGEIRRANLDGTGDELLFDGVWTPNSMEFDASAGKLYWIDSNTSFVSNHIARANLDGSDFEVLYQGLDTSSGLVNLELDLDAGLMYWCDEINDDEKGVWRANMDGSDAERIYSSPAGWNAGSIDLVLDDAPPCPEDLDGDGSIGQSDLGILLASYLTDAGGDIDGDGDTDQADLGQLLAAYGQDC
jgi:sugar lactone lactonase YvrE